MLAEKAGHFFIGVCSLRLYAIVLVVFAAALARPDLVRSAVVTLRTWLEPLVRRPRLAGALIVLLPLLIRIALLSRWPIPEPKIPDEFSYLYAADTFAEGRLANPTHSHWPFFETVYVLSQPVTASKYPPVQGAVLAAGQVLLGHPWFGVWLSCGVMTAAIYWLFLAWLPRLWACAGALWFGMHTGLLTGWMNSYWGGAAAAAAGAILFGCYTRLRKRPTAALGALFGVAWVVLANSRPYEGALVLGLPLALLLLRQGLPRPALWGAFATLALGACGSLLYNHAITGHSLKLPYALHDEQYAFVGPFWMQPLKPKPSYRQSVMAHTFEHDELRYRELSQWAGWQRRAGQWRLTLESFGPLPVVVPGCVAWLLLCRTRRYRVPAFLLILGFFFLNLTVFHFPHYAAPFAGIMGLFIVFGWRMLAQVSLENSRLAHAALTALIAYAGLSVALSLRASVQPPSQYPITHFRHVIQEHLDEDFDQHLIFVTHPREPVGINPDWVYNKARIDDAKTVWAADFGDEENQKLLRYYPTRTAWRLHLDDRTLTLQPYRVKPGQVPLRFIAPGRRIDEK